MLDYYDSKKGYFCFDRTFSDSFPEYDYVKMKSEIIKAFEISGTKHFDIPSKISRNAADSIKNRRMKTDLHSYISRQLMIEGYYMVAKIYHQIINKSKERQL